MHSYMYINIYIDIAHTHTLTFTNYVSQHVQCSVVYTVYESPAHSTQPTIQSFPTPKVEEYMYFEINATWNRNSNKAD